MRIAWGTPFNERSAIARYSLFVVRELARRDVEVEILRLELGEAQDIPVISKEFKAHHPDRIASAIEKGAFDAVVLNIGDHLPFHGSIQNVLFRESFISVFHDSVLDSLAWEAARRRTDLGRYLAGAGQVAAGEPGERGHLSSIAALSHGAIVHGQHYLGKVSDSAPGPTISIPLCYPDTGALDPVDIFERGELTVVTFGMINPNKQPDRLIKAVAGSQALAGRTRLRFVGPVEDHHRHHLQTLASSLGLRQPEFTGWVRDEDLFLALRDADVICCLRHPISEGGSASLISALYSARPLIVPDAASYAELPDGMAWKVPYGDAPEPVSTVLEEIWADRKGAYLRALVAREWARRRFSATLYVDALCPHIDSCLRARPVAQAGRQLGLSLSRLGIANDAASTERLALALDFMW